MRREGKVKRSFFILLAAASLLLFAACTDPILYTLVIEEPIIDDDLPNEITVQKVVTDGSYYYGAAGKIFYRLKSSGSTWRDASPPQSGALGLTLEIFGAGPTLYGGFFATDGTGLGLWKATNPSAFNWEKEDNSGVTGENVQIIMLKIAGPIATPNLFVSTAKKNAQDEFDYYLYYYDSGEVFQTTPETEIGPISSPITDITWDGTKHWVIAGRSLYRGALGSMALQTGSDDPFDYFEDPRSCYGGVYAIGTTVYLSAHNGKVYAWDSSWHESNKVEVSESIVKFTEMIDIGTTNLFVGTRQHGYYHLIGNNPSELFSNMNRFSDVSNVDLYNGAVLRFFFDSPSVFACTAGAGLWRSDNSGDTWSQE